MGNPPVGSLDSAHDKGYTAADGMPSGVLPTELETEPRCPMGIQGGPMVGKGNVL